MPFAKSMGINVTEATKERVLASMVVRPDLCTTGQILHGGAAMAFADALGGIAAFLNLAEESQMTTTIESKTNFLRAAPQGQTIFGETLPMHIGRRTSVWQTKISLENEKLVAIVTQTQMAL